MTQDASSFSPSTTPAAQPDAAGNRIAAWPSEPQQLFLLLPGEATQADDWQALAHSLAQTFAQGAVAVLALPADMAQAKADPAAAVAALRQLVQQWQARAGLDFARTALIAQGQLASIAMQAVMRHVDLCARLFAVGGHLPEQTMPIAEHTCLHWLHVQDESGPSAEQAHEWGQCLQALDVDFTLDVLESSAVTAGPPELQQRILHLLQNHVPRRLWREALASANALDAAQSATRGDQSTWHQV
ncbi:MAG: hypothetical protein Q4A28_01620 [Brachymonas sp.]|nr:hypothetical protein [Brachymonas sp.]